MPHLTFSIDNRLEEVAGLGTLVRRACLDHGATSGEADDVELAVCEAVNNVIRHRLGEGSPGQVRVHVVAEKGGAEIEIENGCPPGGVAQPLELSPPSGVEDLPEGGMGLAIIHAVMDEVGVRERDGQCLLLLVKRFSGKRT